MTSNFSSEIFPKWFAEEFFQLRDKTVHNATVYQFDQDEDSLRARMFATASWNDQKATYVFPTGENVVVLYAIGRYRSTVEYHQVTYSKETGERLDQTEFYHGKTHGITKRFGPAFEVSSKIRKGRWTGTSSYVLEQLREQQIDKFLRSMIRKSDQLERAHSFLFQRIKANDYKQASQICNWLDSLGLDVTIGNYIKYGFCVVSERHNYYINNNSWSRNVVLSTVARAAKDRETRDKILLAAFGQFKKDFSNKIHGSLLTRLTD